MAWGRKGRKDGYVSPFDSNDPDRYVNPGTTGEGASGSMPAQSAAGQDWTTPDAHDGTAGTPSADFRGASGIQPTEHAQDDAFGSGATGSPGPSGTVGGVQSSAVDSTPFPSDAAASVDIPGDADVTDASASPMPDQTAAPTSGPTTSSDGSISSSTEAPIPNPASAYDVPSAPPQPSGYDAPTIPGFTSPVPVHAPAGGTGTSAQGNPYTRNPGAFGSPGQTPGQSGTPYATGGPGAPTTPLERANATARTKSNKHPVGKIIGIIVVVIVAMNLFGHIPTALFHGIFGGGSSPSYSSSSSDTSSSSSDSSDEPAPRWKTQVGEGDIALSDDEPAAKVSIDKMEAGPDDDTGHHTVLVTYTWTNNTSEGKPFHNFTATVYQDGIGMRSTRLYSNAPAGYDRNADSADVQPNATQTLKVAYWLADPAKEVVVAVFGYSGGTDIVADTFTRGADGSYASKGEAPDSIKNGGENPTFMNYTVEGVPKAGIKDADGYSGKLLGMGGAVTQTSIASAVFGPGLGVDDANKDIVVITYRWRNDGERPWKFSDATQYAVYQNGVECDLTGVSSDPGVKGYDNWSQSISILPGATYATTVAYKIDLSKPVDVQVKGYVNDDSVVLERTFTQGGAGTTDTAGGSGSVGGTDTGKQDPTVE